MGSSHAGTDAPRFFGALALLAGILSLVLLGGSSIYAPLAPAELLPYFRANQSRFLVAAVAALVWAVACVPFAVALGRLLGTDRPALGLCATLLAAGGAIMLGFSQFITIGAFLAIEAAGKAAPSAAQADYQAALWSNLGYFLSDPGLMTLGAGQFLFAWLAWKTRALARWLSVVGFVGGLAGLLTLAVYQASALAAGQIAAFGIWGIAVGVKSLRSFADSQNGTA